MATPTGNEDPVATSTTEGNYYTKLSDGGKDDHDGAAAAEEKTVAGTPTFVWVLLALAVLIGSSAGTITKKLEIDHAAVVSVAGWRFQVTAMVLLPCFLYQWLHMTSEARAKLLLKKNVVNIFLSAFGLAAYFALWNWAVLHTSLTHAMFLSFTTPLYLAFATVLTGGTLQKLETVGVGLGIIGSLVIAAGGRKSQRGSETTLAGDLVAFLAAGGFALYFTASHSCRKSLPIYVYMFPSTVLTAIMLVIAGIFLEGWGSWVPGDPDVINGPFGWLSNREFILWTIFLGTGVGFLVYALCNICFAYTSSLVVSMVLNLSPLCASIIGWLAGLNEKPNLYTWVGGAVVLVAMIITSLAKAGNEVNKEDTADKGDVESRVVIHERLEGNEALLQDWEQNRT
ncbi:hypothetical protein R1sor_012765 [Riccia sorocarpa]|uniref:EamA domain-containing protein n=1 Tax=Riccia sorocarpa TaxID=122646 RepID=A0ABD3IAW6_9MARC